MRRILLPVKDVLEQLSSPSVNVYASLLRRCSSSRCLADGRRVHDHIVRSGLFEQSVHLGNLLIQMYRKCGNKVSEARAVFDQMPRRDVVSWSCIMAAYAQSGQCRQTVELYHKMDVQPNEMVFVSTLAACSGLQDLALGKSIHSRITCPSILESVFVGTALVNMYSKCGALAEAREVFSRMRNKDVVAWTTMITALSQNGDSQEAFVMYDRMTRDMKPNSVTLIAVLSACKDREFLPRGRETHFYIVSAGMQDEIPVQNALVSMYAKCGQPDDALMVFQRMPVRDTVSWNSMISAFAQNSQPAQAIRLFYLMNLDGYKPVTVTFLGVFAACASMRCLITCKRVYAYLLLMDSSPDLNVKSAALTAFAKSGDLETCERLFLETPTKNVVSWTAMLTAYTFHGQGSKALELYHMMVLQAVVPDNVALLNAIYSCSLIGSLTIARKLHSQIANLTLETQLKNALIIMYSRCGSLEDARRVFDGIKEKNQVTWNAMLGSYVQHGYDKEVIQLHSQMMTENSSFKGDSITTVILLTAYAGLGELAEGRKIHASLSSDTLEHNLMVGNALVSMYARGGALQDARAVFEAMKDKDTISWSSIIAGYSHHGPSRDAIELYARMHQEGMKPDHITYVSILNSCSHGGLLDQACVFFRSMVEDHCLVPWLDHYKCMVDALGRVGYLPSAEALISDMPYQPDFVAWNTLLGSCKVHGDAERGSRAAKNVSDLNPKFTGSHVLLSNIYTV